MSKRERKIDAIGDVSFIDIFPKLSALDAFQEERPDAIEGQKLTKLIPSLDRKLEWNIEQFLSMEPAAKFITWEFDVTEKVLHFGYFYRKIFRGVGKILYSFHKNGEFSGDVISRMRVSKNLKVNHPYHGVKSSPSDFSAGKKADIRHFRWLLARVVKKCFPDNYEERLSCYFKTIFSEVFLHQAVLKHNYMFQYFNPVLFNKKHNFQFIHALENIAARNTHSYYVKNTGLYNKNYKFETWWLRIQDDNNEKKKETMMGAVYYYEDKQIKAYKNQPNSLLRFLRNLQEHFMSGMQTKNSRISNENRENKMENARRKAFNESLERKKMGHGTFSHLQNEGKKLPYLFDNARLFNLPSYNEMVEEITQKFPGIYSSLMDTYIRYFNGKEMAEFGCTLDQVLQEEGPFAGKMYRVYGEAS